MIRSFKIKAFSVSLALGSVLPTYNLASASADPFGQSFDSPYSPPAIPTEVVLVDSCESLWFRLADKNQNQTKVPSIFNDPNSAKQRIAAISSMLNVSVVRYQSENGAQSIPGTLFLIEAQDDDQFQWVHAQLPELTQKDSRILRVEVDSSFPSLEKIGLASMFVGPAVLLVSVALKETLDLQLGDDQGVVTYVTSAAFALGGGALVIFDMLSDLLDTSSTNESDGRQKRAVSDAHFARFYTEISRHVTDQQVMRRLPKNEPYAFFITKGPSEEWRNMLRREKEFLVLTAEEWLQSLPE